MTKRSPIEYVMQYVFSSFGLLLVFFLFKDTHGFIAGVVLILFILVQLLHVIGVVLALRKIIGKE